MKIVNLISGKDLGGPKQTFLHYSDNLRQLGHQVTHRAFFTASIG